MTVTVSIKQYGNISCQCRRGNVTFIQYMQRAILGRSINTWEYHTHIISLPSMLIMYKKTWGRCALHNSISKSAIIATAQCTTSCPLTWAVCKTTSQQKGRDFHTNLFSAISIGTPGLTMAIFIHSLPRSTDITATEAGRTKKNKREWERKTVPPMPKHTRLVHQNASWDISLAILFHMERTQERCSIWIKKYTWA